MARKTNRIHYTSYYLKRYGKLPLKIRAIQDKKERWFKESSFDARLDMHRLKGKYRDFYSYSVTRSYRVLFRFINNNEVIFYDIGTHEIYK